MKNRDVEVVKTIEGFYDEKAEALSVNIAKRRLCLKHDWVNASLHWSKQVEIKTEGEKSSGSCYHISIESLARENFNSEWGIGYGGIRFCKNCKQIDCIHLWEWQKEYWVRENEFCHDSSIIAKCKICERRILKSGVRLYSSSPEAYNLIQRVVKELNIPYDNPVSSSYGSNFYTLLPMRTAYILKTATEAEAEGYVRSVFISGVCER